MKIFWQILFFGISGTLGFIVDTGILYALKGILGLYIARVISFLFAMTCTWLFNRSIKFRAQRSGHSKKKEFGIYFVLMLLGGFFNYSTYAWLVSQSVEVSSNPVLGVAAGSLVGMVVNLLTSRFLLYRFKKP